MTTDITSEPQDREQGAGKTGAASEVPQPIAVAARLIAGTVRRVAAAPIPAISDQDAAFVSELRAAKPDENCNDTKCQDAANKIVALADDLRTVRNGSRTASDWIERLADHVEKQADDLRRARDGFQVATAAMVRLASKVDDQDAELAQLRKRNDLYVEALGEIKATVDGQSTQPVTEILAGLIQEIGGASEAEAVEAAPQVSSPVSCNCICHHQPGVTHMVPCCSQPPLDPFAKTSAVPHFQQLPGAVEMPGQSAASAAGAPLIPFTMLELPWDRRRGELVLEIHHVLTEPVCPTVTLKWETSGERIAGFACNTIEEGIRAAMVKVEEIATAEGVTYPPVEKLDHSAAATPNDEPGT